MGSLLRSNLTAPPLLDTPNVAQIHPNSSINNKNSSDSFTIPSSQMLGFSALLPAGGIPSHQNKYGKQRADGSLNLFDQFALSKPNNA